MRIVVSDFMSLGGVVQAPGGPGEDEEAARTAWHALPSRMLRQIDVPVDEIGGRVLCGAVRCGF